jgi:sulfatase maturation enzyme AslB (radical SAM superfamily)
MTVHHLEITTMIGCKVACLYCPQDKISNRYTGTDRVMTLDDFQLYLETVPSDVVLHFTGFAEPFLNASCTDMIEYAVRRGHPIYLSTTLTGMTIENARRLARLPYREFQIHLPSAQKLMNLTVDDSYLAVLSELVAASVITEMHYHGDEVHSVIGAWLRERGTAFRGILIQDRAGNLDTSAVVAQVKKPITRAASPQGRLYCDRVYQNVVLPNGDVALCCNDWKAEYVLGNLKRDSLHDLYRSDVFRRVLRGLRRPGTPILCRACTFPRVLGAKERWIRRIERIPQIGPPALRLLRSLRRAAGTAVRFVTRRSLSPS